MNTEKVEPKETLDWEGEFDKRFIELHPKMDCTKPTPIWDCESLKQFIHHLLISQRSQLIKEIEERIRLRMIKEANTPLGERKSGWDILIEVRDTLLKT